MNQLTSPEMRKELVSYLQGLADPEYQRRVWIGGQSEGDVKHDELDYAVHFLYDDTALATDARSTIGWILKDASEADSIAAVVASIEDIFVKHGTKLSDAQYIELPEWKAVVANATAAAACLSER
ncbi:hypothetical protein SAMN05216303_1184 [Rhodoferax sp. OV413]|uniref:SCO4402 family protein n=1 Tax=Rhodoferax sp. OV413 TaxID=1855285 RepID=UPI000889E8CB|nr:hypothetical protein [Rhodoferax sp. OV413]SDP94998.1 hypothetical protein SAMN05216303_1184 [Rhodoferax sp. OV413]